MARFFMVQGFALLVFLHFGSLLPSQSSELTVTDDAHFELVHSSLLSSERKGFSRSLKQLGQLASSSPSSNTTLILAAKRTQRRDPLNGFRVYRDGWDIRNRHYWASVGLTGIPGFLLAAIWLASGLLLVLSLCLYCCCCRQRHVYEHHSLWIPLAFLLLLSLAALAGCVFVYLGQGKFSHELSGTLDYVVHQSNATVENLKSVAVILQEATTINIDQISLADTDKQKIQSLSKQLNDSSVKLEQKTEDNAQKIRDGIKGIRLAMVIISGVMFGLVLLGLVLAACDIKSVLYILVFIGWFLVAGTWILCGIYILLHNAIGDTCVAMEEWVVHPNASTNLDDILPCADQATTNETLFQSKDLTVSTVDIVNRALSVIANGNSLNFNQSGPLVPLLCSPYGSPPNYEEQSCAAGRVTVNEAAENWKSYICQTGTGTTCTTTGRLTQDFYNQLVQATTIAKGLYFNVPFLIRVANCDFVRYTFQNIIDHRCPELRKFAAWQWIGLALISGGSMFSILFWIVVTRKRYRDYPHHDGKNTPPIYRGSAQPQS